VSTPFVIAAMAAFGLAALAPQRGRARLVAAALGVLVLAALLLARWREIGHLPVFGTFEMDLAESAVFVGLGLPLAARYGGAWRVALAFAVLTLAHALTLESAPTPLTISELSLWIDLHAPLAYLAWAFYAHAALLGFRREAEPLALRLWGYGFVAHTALGFIGVYYASVLFATPWAWDPAQTLGLLSWLLVAVLIHFRLFFHLDLRRQRYLGMCVWVIYIASAKAPMHLPPGQSFHVFELGSLAGGAP